MENTSSADLKRMSVHFKHVREKYGAGGLSFQRYKDIRAGLIPTAEEISEVCAMLMTNSCMFICQFKN